MAERSGDTKERHWRGGRRRWFWGLLDDLGVRRVMEIRRCSSWEVCGEDGGRGLVLDTKNEETELQAQYINISPPRPLPIKVIKNIYVSKQFTF